LFRTLRSLTGSASSALLSDSPSRDGGQALARPYISSFGREATEDRWGSRGRQPRVFVVLFRTSATRDTDHHAGQGRSLHHAVAARHTTAPSLLRTHAASRSMQLFKLAYDPITRRQASRRQGSPRRNICRASTSGVDGYYFAPAEHTWTRNWNRRRFGVFSEDHDRLYF
jgi:hypothetical protein